MVYPKYPDKLKATYWDKHKGLLAKAKGFTGVGAALTTAESDWGQCPAITFSPQSQYKTWDEYKDAFENAKKEYGKITKARASIKVAIKALTDAKGIYAGNVLLKGAVKTCDEMINAATFFDGEIKAIDELWKNTEKSMKQKFELAKKNVKDGITLCENNAKKLTATSTSEDYSKLYWQGLRTLSAAVQVSPDYKDAWQPIFKPLSSVQPGTLKTPKDVAEHVKKCQTAVANLKKAVG